MSFGQHQRSSASENRSKPPGFAWRRPQPAWKEGRVQTLWVRLLKLQPEVESPGLTARGPRPAVRDLLAQGICLFLGCESARGWCWCPRRYLTDAHQLRTQSSSGLVRGFWLEMSPRWASELSRVPSSSTQALSLAHGRSCVLVGPLSGSAGWPLPKVFPHALEVVLVPLVALQERWTGWCRPDLPRTQKPDLVPGQLLRGVIICELRVGDKDEHQARV